MTIQCSHLKGGRIFFYFYGMHYSTYISDLLYRYECVIIPGFGAFLAHKISAYHDAEQNVFFPPKKRISFNAQLKENDGLLSNYIATAENISYTEALGKLQSYAHTLETRILNGETILLDKIGTLTQNESSQIKFEPVSATNYLTEAFGLSSFETKPIMREVHKQEVEALEEKAPIHITTARRNNTWLKYAAVGVLAIGLSGTFGFLHFKDIADYNFAQEQKAKKQVENTIQHATFTIENPLPAVTLNAFKPKGSYHIVAGAFRVPENAESRVKELREAGYKARTLGENKYGLHQVVYGSYTDRTEALNDLRKIRTNDNSNAWLLIQEVD